MAALLVAGVLSACQNGETTKTEEPTVEIMQKEDPKTDDTINILMIGNSFSYYFTDELYGIAKANGVKMRVCNIYASGCTMQQHWEWWKNNQANYTEFTITDDSGVKTVNSVTLKYCLEQYNWDVITLQEASGRVRKNSAEEALNASHTYRAELYAYLKEQFPQSRHMWHQTWAYQVGFTSDSYKVEYTAEQNAYYERMKQVAISTCQEFGVERINSGDAWQIARANPVIGDNLCARLSVNNGEGDYYHDGDIGGGQYLNACVWFEVITGQSCVGNTFRPSYDLPEDKIAALQQTAHQAVASR